MPGTALDEELTEGLKQAKKTPRHFALIVKGANPVKLMVRKKKFRDGELAKAKTEAKGNDFIVGILAVSGADFAFQVLAEPTVKPTKLKELIAEQTEMTAKPRWEVVTALPEIGDEEEVEQAEVEGTETQPTSETPSPSSLDAGQLLAAMNKLTPQITAAAAAHPDRKKELVTAVAAFQQQHKSGQLEQAQDTLTKLAELLKSLGSPSGGSGASPTGGSGKVSLVKLGKARLEWITVRDAALADLRALQATIAAEFKSDAEQLQALKAALTKLNEGVRELEAKLPDELDLVLNAEEANRPPLIAAARKTIDRLTNYLNTDPIMAELDDNEVIPGMKVVAPVRAKINEISAALG